MKVSSFQSNPSRSGHRSSELNSLQKATARRAKTDARNAAQGTLTFELFRIVEQNLIDNSADFVTIYVGVNRFLLNTNITIDQFMHYVNQVGLSRINRFIKRDFRTILVNFDQLKACNSFWVMQNPETSLNTLMNEQQISRNCKSAHRTMIYVTKVI